MIKVERRIDCEVLAQAYNRATMERMRVPVYTHGRLQRGAIMGMETVGAACMHGGG